MRIKRRERKRKIEGVEIVLCENRKENIKQKRSNEKYIKESEREGENKI